MTISSMPADDDHGCSRSSRSRILADDTLPDEARTMHPAAWLLLAISSEIVATSALKASNGFRNLVPAVVVVVGYAVSFYFMSLSLRDIPLGVVYAVWSGVGTAAIAVIGVVFFQETLGWVGIGGIVLIVLGVVLLNASGAHN
jgi:small multidrug resistance pump